MLAYTLEHARWALCKLCARRVPAPKDWVCPRRLHHSAYALANAQSSTHLIYAVSSSPAARCVSYLGSVPAQALLTTKILLYIRVENERNPPHRPSVEPRVRNPRVHPFSHFLFCYSCSRDRREHPSTFRLSRPRGSTRVRPPTSVKDSLRFRVGSRNVDR